ncbi:hypothetical protein ABC974_25035 [Sphingomonas oligophenolica]|uniref:Uncharacterized protein n=1 Tax=Sphingomonas oligophenolica TaxID=301154 RepID=A0ABU9YB20_9SPHN
MDARLGVSFAEDSYRGLRYIVAVPIRLAHLDGTNPQFDLDLQL